MSVYFEALKSGRITRVHIDNHGGSIRRALWSVKRDEAEARNAKTPDHKRRAARR